MVKTLTLLHGPDPALNCLSPTCHTELRQSRVCSVVFRCEKFTWPAGWTPPTSQQSVRRGQPARPKCGVEEQSNQQTCRFLSSLPSLPSLPPPHSHNWILSLIYCFLGQQVQVPFIPIKTPLLLSNGKQAYSFIIQNNIAINSKTKRWRIVRIDRVLSYHMNTYQIPDIRGALSMSTWIFVLSEIS